VLPQLSEELVSDRVRTTIKDLKRVEDLLGADAVDPRILVDFREALDRVRNTAWSAQQYISRRETQQDFHNVLSIAASERVRAMYRLCQSLQADLGCSDIRFQPGQLLQLHSAVRCLIERLEQEVEQSG
jgi:hypothetical protein